MLHERQTVFVQYKTIVIFKVTQSHLKITLPFLSVQVASMCMKLSDKISLSVKRKYAILFFSLLIILSFFFLSQYNKNCISFMHGNQIVFFTCFFISCQLFCNIFFFFNSKTAHFILISMLSGIICMYLFRKKNYYNILSC